jgi:hypothetical protein
VVLKQANQLSLGRRWLRTILVATSIVIALGLLLVQMARAPETYPWGDTAITSIATLSAARGSLATGAYSRFQWNHPGPLLYQLLAPLYAVSGHREISIKWTVLMLNVAALAGLLSVVARPAPWLSILIALALTPLVYREQRLLFWTWNPIVPLLPMALATAVSARIATGTLRFLPLFCALGSFAVQAHVGFAPVVLTLSVMTMAVLAWRIRRQPFDPAQQELGRLALMSAVVMVVLWAVPVVHEFSTSDRNLSKLAEFFFTTPRPERGWATTFAIAANQLVGPLTRGWELTTNVEAPSTASWPILVGAAVQFPLLLGASILAFRRGAAFHGAFALTALMTSGVGLLAVRAIVGPVSDYLVVWLAVQGALNLAVIAAEALHLVVASPGRPVAARGETPAAFDGRCIPGGSVAPPLNTPGIRGRRALPPGRLARLGATLAFHHGLLACRWMLVAYVSAAAVLGGTRLVGKHAADARSTIVRTLATDLEQYCRREGIDRPLLRFSGPAWQVAVGLVLQFYKSGRAIALPDDRLYLVGDPFKATGREPAEFYLMFQDDTALPAGTTRHEWLTTHGSYRLVRVFRD